MNDKGTEQDVVYWLRQINEIGYEAVKIKVKGNREFGRNPYILLALERYDKNQQDEKELKRDEREEKTLELAQEAHDRAEKSYQQSWFAIAIAGVTALVTIAIAFIN